MFCFLTYLAYLHYAEAETLSVCRLDNFIQYSVLAVENKDTHNINLSTKAA